MYIAVYLQKVPERYHSLNHPSNRPATLKGLQTIPKLTVSGSGPSALAALYIRTPAILLGTRLDVHCALCTTASRHPCHEGPSGSLHLAGCDLQLPFPLPGKGNCSACARENLEA